jgi:hypothetical protein
MTTLNEERSAASESAAIQEIAFGNVEGHCPVIKKDGADIIGAAVIRERPLTECRREIHNLSRAVRLPRVNGRD